MGNIGHYLVFPFSKKNKCSGDMSVVIAPAFRAKHIYISVLLGLPSTIVKDSKTSFS